MAELADGSMTREAMQIHSDSVVTLAPDVVICALGDGAALLDLRSSTYFNLNPVASFVWERLAEPQSLAGLAADVREEFATGDADIAADLVVLVASLADAGLVTVIDAASDAPAG